MTTELAFPGLLVHERNALRDALEHRRRGLTAAMRLYEDAAIETAPRLALVRRTRLAMADIDRGLARVHEAAYGVCRECQSPLPIAVLTLRPLATHCEDCATTESVSPIYL
jgi:RNA polymerase-binding transcription factor DksA